MSLFKYGSIRKIQVKNFVTYEFVEICPGPNLNMLIGPNGTGKSTIVAAIILGLGGNPKVVGRGTKVGEYVKHNCAMASIIIHIQGERANEYIKICREFNVTDQTTWYINNKKVLAKDIYGITRQFRIQVDNLCQFLPQDKVQDFAKMNQQDLLRQTLIALCRNDLIEQHDSLVEYMNEYNRISEAISSNTVRLKKVKEANIRLESKVANYKKRTKYLQEIVVLERKIAWNRFETLRIQYEEIKEDLKAAKGVYETRKNALKPTEIKINQVVENINKLQKENSNLTHTRHEWEGKIQSIFDRISEYRQRINQAKNIVNDKILENEGKQVEMRENSKRIDELKKIQNEHMQRCGSDEQINTKVKHLKDGVDSLKSYINDLQNEKELIGRKKLEENTRLRSYENELGRLENIKEQRLKYLQSLDQDTYNAVLWLRENIKMFQHQVYEPILMELNVLDAKNSIYVENVIPRRDRLAFTCVSKQDMNTLIRLLRNEKKLTINVLHSAEIEENISSIQAAIPIEQLRRYGFYAYLKSLFTAPDPIMRYLCNTYRVHEIPVGDANTNQLFDRVPKEIRVFFSDNQRFTVNYSRYTGEKSVRQNVIKSDGGLSISLDIMKLVTLEGQIKTSTQCLSQFTGKLSEIQTKIDESNKKLSTDSDELKSLNNIKQQIVSVTQRICVMIKKVDQLKNTSINIEEIERISKEKIQKYIQEMRPFFTQLLNANKIISESLLTTDLNNQSIIRNKNRIHCFENDMQELRKKCDEAQIIEANARNHYNDHKAKLKAALMSAKSISNNLTPDDEGFQTEFQPEFNQLSDNIDELVEQKDELQVRVECLHTADNDELSEYKDTLETMETLQKTVATNEVALQSITSKIQVENAKWLTPLGQLIASINEKFSDAFGRMGCAGEISLNMANDINDSGGGGGGGVGKEDIKYEFDKYGLAIKVTYRNGEPLQELNNTVQSGGERAVATAVFMLSLQEMTPVPFRCVDEINQGMDPSNERRVFDLMLETTSQSNTSQYFLVTPKLIPNLTYSRSMMVHIVHNGPLIEQDNKWFKSKLCNPQTVQIS